MFRIIIYTFASHLTKGTLADRLGNGLQNRVGQFDSARYLNKTGKFFIELSRFILILIYPIGIIKAQRKIINEVMLCWAIYSRL